MRFTRVNLTVWIAVAVAVVAVTGATVAARLGVLNQSGKLADSKDAKDLPAPSAVFERMGLDSVYVPSALAERIGLTTATAAAADHPIRLPGFHGVLALDNECMSRVHSRFEGEVVEIGQWTAEDGTTRPLRVGDRVEAGDLLAVVWSTHLGEKKSQLIDAIAKLRSEEELRDRLKKLASEGASSGRTYRDAEKAVHSRLVEVANAERTLRTWRLNDEDIAKIRTEAECLVESQVPGTDLNDWARVEVRASMGGVVLEKNIVLGAIVDTTTDLFKIGDTSHLVVWAHVYEEDLPLLESLPRPIPWSVSVPSRAGSEFSGTLDRIGAVIDQSQHTGLVTGRVENTTGDLKVGQFVMVSIDMPPREDELELPVTAVVEDGRGSVVFLQESSQTNLFRRTAVNVMRRSHDSIYVKIEEHGIQPGTQIVTSGAMMVQNAMNQLAVPQDRHETATTEQSHASAMMADHSQMH
ncbi:MAG TPA: efflux RND transporter periplasmic adaptor subunit [Planctomycetaceae bacterium]|nr:efflux RND transporter periplasmic adaptor subunit [Planctomycetaceae bacterium]